MYGSSIPSSIFYEPSVFTCRSNYEITTWGSDTGFQAHASRKDPFKVRLVTLTYGTRMVVFSNQDNAC